MKYDAFEGIPFSNGFFSCGTTCTEELELRSERNRDREREKDGGRGEGGGREKGGSKE